MRTIYNVVITGVFVSDAVNPHSLEGPYLVEQMTDYQVSVRRVGEAACVLDSGEVHLPDDPRWECGQCGAPPSIK